MARPEPARLQRHLRAAESHGGEGDLAAGVGGLPIAGIRSGRAWDGSPTPGRCRSGSVEHVLGFGLVDIVLRDQDDAGIDELVDLLLLQEL
jgi:hypothetical protein